MQTPTIRDAMPYLKSNVLPGVTRGAVVEFAAEESIELHLAAIDIAQLLDADEVFITNSIMGVMPVCRIEKKVIGDDKPGPITTRLATRYQSALEQGRTPDKPVAIPPPHQRLEQPMSLGGHDQ